MRFLNSHTNDRGFTLIELLVVIAIIGVLSSVVLASLNSAQENARDAKRMADLKQVQIALEMYFHDNGRYPTETWCDSSLGACATACPCGEEGWSTSSGFYQAFITNGGYMSTLAVDPLNNSSHYYYYEPTSDGLQGYFFRATLESGETWGVCGGTFSASWCN